MSCFEASVLSRDTKTIHFMRRFIEGDLDLGWLFYSNKLLFIDEVVFLDFASDYICHTEASPVLLPGNQFL